MTDEADAIALAAGTAVATVYPAHGGRLGQLEVDGRRLLRGPEDGDGLTWADWGCYPLLPWSNRIPAGRFTHEGRQYEVPVNWKDGSAIHGLSAREPWTVVARSDSTVEETIDVDLEPFHVTGRQRIDLNETHLDLVLEVTNRGANSIPAGLGLHPWFRAGEVRVPADLAWPGDSSIPEGPARPVTPEEDLRSPRVPPPMDRCYTGLTEQAFDLPDLRLEWSGPVTQAVVYSCEPGWVAAEPVTMANDGFRLASEGVDHHGVVVLQPGESMAVSYRFVWGG